MATRFTIQPPQTGREDETIKFTCDDCGDKDLKFPEIHAKVKHHEKHIIVDTSMKQWYWGINIDTDNELKSYLGYTFRYYEENN